MKITTLLLFALVSFTQTPQNNVQNADLFAHWVINDPGNASTFENLDNINFVLESSATALTLPMELSGGGITFLENGTFIEHWWNANATEDIPNFIEGKWVISEKEDQMLLTVTETNRWNGKYIIDKLTPRSLRLKRMK